MELSQIAEIDATDLFEGENINWQYCMQHATFSHKEACEFIIHIGDDEFIANCIQEMQEFGCTEDFIRAYREAKATGAWRVLFWA